MDDAALEAALFPALPPSRVARPEPDWKDVHRELQRHKGVTVRMFEFWGGVPELVTPTTRRRGCAEPSRYEPDLNPTYQELATHRTSSGGFVLGSSSPRSSDG